MIFLARLDKKPSISRERHIRAIQSLLVQNDHVENILLAPTSHVFTALGFSPLSKVCQKLSVNPVEYSVAPASVKSMKLCDKDLLSRGGTPLDPVV